MWMENSYRWMKSATYTVKITVLGYKPAVNIGIITCCQPMDLFPCLAFHSNYLQRTSSPRFWTRSINTAFSVHYIWKIKLRSTTHSNLCFIINWSIENSYTNKKNYARIPFLKETNKCLKINSPATTQCLYQK